MEPCLKPEIAEEKPGRPTPNPVLVKEGKGWRNFACQHYDACLNLAAKSMWTGFSCKFCELHVTKKESL